jgi:beta-lactamase regulating signal transducer with metallopeptidase domain
VFDSSSLQGLLAWILTYALHSTALLGLAWCAVRLLSADQIRWKERIWKTAVFGGLISASLQAGVTQAPLAGRLEWTHPVPFSFTSEQAAMLPAAVAGPVMDIEFTWDRLLLGLWMLGGLLGVGLFLFAWRRITDRLAGRKSVKSGYAKECLQALARRAGLSHPPRLTVSQQLKSPATVGVLFPQICVPARALIELSESQQEALLAHELSHILRRDSAWFFLCGLVERIFFFQPLNRMARRELQELAEFQCDDWAARNTKDSLGLARCLTEVATWVLDERPVVAVVHMASSNSRLAVRIGRLLDEHRSLTVPSRSRVARLFPVATLTIAAVCLPGASALGDPAAPPQLDTKWSSGVQAWLAGTDVQDRLAGTDVQDRLAGTTTNVTRQEISLAPPMPKGLDELLSMLDAELAQLYTECTTLKAKFANSPNPPHLLEEIDQRVSGLRQRQARLQTILPTLQGRSNSPFPRNPKQEESK